MSRRTVSILQVIFVSLLVSFLAASARASEQQPRVGATPPPCRLAIQDTLLPDFSCNGTKDACYQQAMNVIKQQAIQQNKVLAGCPVPPDDTYLSEFDFTAKHSEYSFVFLPGLYTTAAQLWAFKKTFGDNNGMRVVLPGQGASAWQGGALKPSDWIVATRRAINLASYLGDKVILVGQSTGAFMAVWAAAQPELKISGVAVFEPAMKVRTYYGAALCYIPSLDLAEFPHGRFFEENVNLGCVIRELGEEETPRIISADAIKRMVHIPFYVFVNPYDIIVNSSTTLKFTQALQAAGGDVTVESYSYAYEGAHMHAAVVRLPLRPRYAERLAGDTNFAQTIRGRNSYAEFIARKFNICDSQTNASYLQQFGQSYSSLSLTPVSRARFDSAVAELNDVVGITTLSDETRVTLQTYESLYVNNLVQRDGWSFPVSNDVFLMHETNWTGFNKLCCDTFAKNDRFYTASFEGPTYSTIQQERAQASADISQGISGHIDAVVAHRLAGFIGGQERQFPLSPMVSADFQNSDQWYQGNGKCSAWQDIPAMDVSVADIKAEIRNVLHYNTQMEPTPDDQ